MDSSKILAKVNQVAALDQAETEFFESLLIQRPFRQGELIVKSGDPARYMMFVNDGYLMTYYTDKEGNDHVVQFAATEWWCGDLYSLSQLPATPYTTKALTDGELLLLPRVGHLQLLEKYIKFEKYFRIFFFNGVIRHQNRFVENHTMTAEERYQTFQATYPNLEQYVSQKHIASFLGITPEFLSKIRKRLFQKAALT